MAKKLAFDRWLFTTLMLILLLGLAMVYSASAAVAHGKGVAMNTFLVKQAIAAGLGLVAMFALMHIDYRRLRHPAVVYSALLGVLALLLVVLTFPATNGAHRWIYLGSFSFQPSELAKIMVIVFVAYQIDRKQDEINTKNVLLPCGVVTGLLAGLILVESDLGTSLMVIALAGMLLFLAGLSWRFLLTMALAAAPILTFLVVSEPYRMSRIFAFLTPEKDPLGRGFQALQSLIAVGSGGVFGLGPGNSLQKLYFLPHPYSDFVFSILAEEMGMLGAIGLLLLFGMLLWRGVRAGWRAPDGFGRYLAWGVTGMVVVQALLNISVALALLPTTGIPLPLVSYGGSSLVATLVGCGILLNVSQHA